MPYSHRQRIQCGSPLTFKIKSIFSRRCMWIHIVLRRNEWKSRNYMNQKGNETGICEILLVHFRRKYAPHLFPFIINDRDISISYYVKFCQCLQTKLNIHCFHSVISENVCTCTAGSLNCSPHGNRTASVPHPVWIRCHCWHKWTRLL